MRRACITWLALTLLLGFALAASAQNVQTVPLPIVANVNPPFNVNVAPLNMGEIFDTTQQVFLNGQIGITAPAGSQVSIAADGGQNFDGNRRRLNCGAAGFLEYELLLDDGVTLWGDGGPALGQPGQLLATGGPDAFDYTARTIATLNPLPTAACNDVVLLEVSF